MSTYGRPGLVVVDRHGQPFAVRRKCQRLNGVVLERGLTCGLLDFLREFNFPHFLHPAMRGRENGEQGD